MTRRLSTAAFLSVLSGFAANAACPSTCVPNSGYPWPACGCLNASDLNTAIASRASTTTPTFSGPILDSIPHPSSFTSTDNNKYIISATTDPSLTPQSVGYDILSVYAVNQALLTVPASTTIQNAVTYGSFIVNNADSTSGASAVGYYSFGVAAANNAHIWGSNPVVTDNTTLTTSSGTGKLLWGSELDFNVTSPNTVVRGLDLAGASLVQPSSSIGLRVQPLHTLNNTFPWDYGIWTNDGGATVAMQAGTVSTGNSQASQPIAFFSRTSGGVARNAKVYANQDGSLVLAPATGVVTILAMPTTCAGQPTGALRNNAGVVNVCP